MSSIFYSKRLFVFIDSEQSHWISSLCRCTCPCLVECYWTDTVLFLCLITVSIYLALIKVKYLKFFQTNFYKIFFNLVVFVEVCCWFRRVIYMVCCWFLLLCSELFWEPREGVSLLSLALQILKAWHIINLIRILVLFDLFVRILVLFEFFQNFFLCGRFVSFILIFTTLFRLSRYIQKSLLFMYFSLKFPFNFPPLLYLYWFSGSRL